MPCIFKGFQVDDKDIGDDLEKTKQNTFKGHSYMSAVRHSIVAFLVANPISHIHSKVHWICL